MYCFEFAVLFLLTLMFVVWLLLVCLLVFVGFGV